MRSVGIILARGGSKRVPLKNIHPLRGKPLISYTIECAKESNITDVFVSSDNDEILSVADQYSAQLIKRPLQLARDETPSFLSLKHAVEEAEKVYGKKCYDKVALLQPTSPTRTPDMVNRCLSIDADAVITVHPAHTKDKNATFIENGAVYSLKRPLIDQILSSRAYLIEELLSKDITLSTVVTKYCTDIDSFMDFKHLEKEDDEWPTTL